MEGLELVVASEVQPLGWATHSARFVYPKGYPKPLNVLFLYIYKNQVNLSTQKTSN